MRAILYERLHATAEGYHRFHQHVFVCICNAILCSIVRARDLLSLLIDKSNNGRYCKLRPLLRLLFAPIVFYI